MSTEERRAHATAAACTPASPGDRATCSGTVGTTRDGTPAVAESAAATGLASAWWDSAAAGRVALPVTATTRA